MMAAVRSKDTAPEMFVRRLLHSLGYRFRLHRRDLPGKPDIVFPVRKKAIFVHGCFWHQHEECRGSHLPKSNTSYWIPKLMQNKARDALNLAKLKSAGWKCLVLWECELGKSSIVHRLKAFLR
jgi:DNA mismatch endonuclease (patch repair protein)